MGELVFLCHEDLEIIWFLEYVNLFLPIFAKSPKEYLGAAKMEGKGWSGSGGKGDGKMGAHKKVFFISNDAKISLFNLLDIL